MLKTNAVQFRGIENWVKELLTAQLISKDASVCELYSKGSDIGKWQRCGCAHYYVVEPNEYNKDEAVKRWTEKKKPFKTANFFCMEPTDTDLSHTLQRKIPNDDKIFPFGGLACFGNYLEQSFETEETAKQMLSNAAAITKSGAYFFGYILDSSAAWTRAQKTLDRDQSQQNKERVTIRGELYQLELDRNFKNYTLQVSGESQPLNGHLIKFPVFSKIARDCGFDIISLANWLEFFEDFKVTYAEQLEGYQVKGTVQPKELELVSLMAIFILQKK
jgi:hypothetical protein